MQETGVARRPSEAALRDADRARFTAHCGLPDHAALAGRASADPERSWRALAGWLQFRFRRPPRRMPDPIDGPAHPRWRVDGTANLYDSAVTATLERDAGRSAAVWEGGSGEERRCSYAGPDRGAAALAAGPHGLGLGPGDVVGVCLPMPPETAAAFMACARLGCVTLPLFSGFGADAVAQRLRLGGARAGRMAPGAAARLWR